MKTFDLIHEPIDYIITVHINNMILTPNITESVIMEHLRDLSETYGQIVIELTIKDLFPTFYNNNYLAKVA